MATVRWDPLRQATAGFVPVRSWRHRGGVCRRAGGRDVTPRVCLAYPAIRTSSAAASSRLTAARSMACTSSRSTPAGATRRSSTRQACSSGRSRRRPRAVSRCAYSAIPRRRAITRASSRSGQVCLVRRRASCSLPMRWRIHGGAFDGREVRIDPVPRDDSLWRRNRILAPDETRPLGRPRRELGRRQLPGARRVPARARRSVHLRDRLGSVLGDGVGASSSCWGDRCSGRRRSRRSMAAPTAFS